MAVGFDGLQQQIVLADLMAAGEAAEADVRQVLDPFEIRDDHPAGVEKNIGNHHHSLLP